MATVPGGSQYLTGTHERSVRDAEIATCQRIFCTAVAIVAATAPTVFFVPESPKYRHGTHQQAIHDAQIAASQQIFSISLGAPAGVGLGIGRDFAITQEEYPPWRMASIKSNTAQIATATIQSPVVRSWLQTLPQYPPDQLWSKVQTPQPASGGAAQNPTIRWLRTFPQEYIEQSWESRLFPNSTMLPTATVQLQSVIVDAQEAGEGQLQLSWSASPGAQGYRLYINGVPQPSLISGQQFLVTGLVRDTSYQFNVVAVLNNTDATILSNPVPEEHGSNELMYVYKYSWGNTYESGYHIKYTLFQKV